jgi:hypothetical protein
MEDEFVHKKESPNLLLIEELVNLTTVAIGTEFIVLNYNTKPITFLITKLKSIEILPIGTSDSKIFKINFISDEGREFYLQKFFRGELDIFAPPLIIGGELFEKYKLFKIERKIDIPSLLDGLKKLVLETDIVRNQDLEILNFKVEVITLPIKKETNSKEMLLRIELEKQQKEKQLKELEERKEKARAKAEKEEERRKKKEERKVLMESAVANQTVTTTELGPKVPVTEPNTLNIPKTGPSIISSGPSLGENEKKNKYNKMKQKYLHLKQVLKE